MKWYLMAWKKYARFDGRSRRREFWFFALFHMLAVIVLTFSDMVLGTYSEAFGWGLLSGVYYVAAIFPGVAVGVRRLHDTGRRGWWILLNFIPIAGSLVYLAMAGQDSQAGANPYGLNPKETSPA